MPNGLKSWFERHEDALRLWMIVLLLVFALVSSAAITMLIRAQDDACNALDEAQLTLIKVVEKAYTPLRPDLLTPMQLRDITEQKAEVLSEVKYPPDCDL
jgi:hypothetical protein